MTESIAGIRDARFQTMMPDVLNWMGIRRIDWLCSMSNEKYEAIVGAGIQVMQRVTLPEDYIKESMAVELEAKIASGYHSDSLAKGALAAELMQLGSIRPQCNRLYELAKGNKLDFFALDESRLEATADEVVTVMREAYPDLKIPSHSRLRHLGDVAGLLGSWSCDATEKARRLVDLVTVSVLLDAGAGPAWSYISANGSSYKASEGLGMASVDLFCDGFFSSDPAMKNRVNSYALKNLTQEQLACGLQVSRQNALVGLAGRTNILQKLGEALQDSPDFFGTEVVRPGNMVDFLLSKAEGNKVSLEHLWKVCSEGLSNIWPKQVNGMQGDVWMHSKLNDGRPGADLVPFHKLTQWLVYSLIDSLQVTIGLQVTGTEVLTGLPEYRNGGLLIDTGLLKLKDPAWLSQTVNVSTELVIEWRALTIVLLDKLAEIIRKKVGLSAEALPLTSVLEGGTWKAGRVIAKRLRADGSPPINIRSDGNVF
jgi:hypothetical protein